MTSRKFILGDGGMEKRSIRITHADRILGHLKVQNRPLLTYEIFGWLRENRVAATTKVYRVIEKLLDAGLVRGKESPNAWAVCCGSHDNEIPIFAIFDDDRNVTEHIDADFTDSIAGLSERTNFAPNHSVLEIHSRCSDCGTGVPAH
jgi:Fur family zinc uptake transcriptional regulator